MWTFFFPANGNGKCYCSGICFLDQFYSVEVGGVAMVMAHTAHTPFGPLFPRRQWTQKAIRMQQLSQRKSQPGRLPSPPLLVITLPASPRSHLLSTGHREGRFCLSLSLSLHPSHTRCLSMLTLTSAVTLAKGCVSRVVQLVLIHFGHLSSW